MKNAFAAKTIVLLFLLLAVAGMAKAQQWRVLNTGVTEDLYDICCIDENTIFVCGQNGVILKTEDGGATWQEKFRNEGSVFYDLYFVDDVIGFAYGNILVKTTDGGNNWLPIDTQYPEMSKPLSEKTDDFYNITRIYATDADTLYFLDFLGWLSKSTDGGMTASYILQDFSCYRPMHANYWRLFFEDNIGYVVYVFEEIYVYKTIDYGNSWEKVFEIDDLIYKNSAMLRFIDKNNIKLFGKPVSEPYLNYDNVICTNDGFASTTMEKCYTDYWIPTYFRDFKFSSNGNGCYIASTGLYEGDVYCYAAITSDGGTHWKYCADGICNEYYVNGVDGIDTVYYLVADNGIVYRWGEGMSNNTETLEINASIYPNPTNNVIEICGENVDVVELYSSMGKCLLRKHIDAKSSCIDIHDFADGVYFVRISDGEKHSKIIKLVKQK